jgi:CRP-like cAMP-binding protein
MDPVVIESLLKQAEPFTVTPGMRTDVQISQIQSSLTSFKFFKNLESPDFLKGICQFLTLEVFEPFDKIANFGEVLDRSFFVLYGSLSILTPELNSPLSISQKEVKETLTKQTTYLRKNTIILGNSKDLVNRLKSMIVRNPVRRASVKVDTEFIRKLTKISDFKAGKQINPNESFGESSLFERVPCNSYIEARTLSICAVLTREDYQKALQAEEDRQNLEKSDFLHEIPIFYQVSKTSLVKLASFFTVQKFSKGQIVYREDMPADMIYFIKSGDFQVSKCQDSVTKKIIDVPRGFLSSQKSLLKVDNARDIRLSHEIQVAIRGKYEVLGYDEYFHGQVLRSHSCKCISAVGVLLAIKTFVNST